MPQKGGDTCLLYTSCRTKTTVGYPQITVSGLVEDGKDAGKLAIYPDAEGKAIVAVAEEAKYKSLSYQWQKLVGGEWKNMPAYKTKELTIANASAADKGTYRCRVNAIYFDETSQKEFSISAYTDALETVYTKRTPEVVLTAKAATYGKKQDMNGIHAEVELHSASKGNTTAPKGTVTSVSYTHLDVYKRQLRYRSNCGHCCACLSE